MKAVGGDEHAQAVGGNVEDAVIFDQGQEELHARAAAT